MERTICEHWVVRGRRQFDTTDVVLEYLGTWVRHGGSQHLAHTATR